MGNSVRATNVMWPHQSQAPLQMVWVIRSQVTFDPILLSSWDRITHDICYYQVRVWPYILQISRSSSPFLLTRALRATLQPVFYWYLQDQAYQVEGEVLWIILHPHYRNSLRVSYCTTLDTLTNLAQWSYLKASPSAAVEMTHFIPLSPHPPTPQVFQMRLGFSFWINTYTTGPKSLWTDHHTLMCLLNILFIFIPCLLGRLWKWNALQSHQPPSCGIFLFIIFFLFCIPFFFFYQQTTKHFLHTDSIHIVIQALIFLRLDYLKTCFIPYMIHLFSSAFYCSKILLLVCCLFHNLWNFFPVTFILRPIHWLPVVTEIKFKVLIQSWKGFAPYYLCNQHPNDTLACQLMSTASGRAAFPSLRYEQ